MIPDNVAIAIHQVVRAAYCGNKPMQALLYELERLYAAAGERRPAALGGYDPCTFEPADSPCADNAG